MDADFVLPVFGALWTLLAVGLLGVTLVSRKLPRAEARALWFKYVTYAVIVHAVVLAILCLPRVWPPAAAILAGVGLLELLRAWAQTSPRRPRQLWVALPLYGAIAVGFACFACQVERREQVFVFVVVCVFDGFCQIVGQGLGRHPLVPAISPRKTVEGLVGGLVAAASVALALAHEFGSSRFGLIAPTAAVCLAALAGDLLGSFAKRRFGRKDFSRLIPAHGGLLDRFGSFFVAGAVWASLRPAAAWLPPLAPGLLLAALALMVLLLAELLRRSQRVSAEATRKLAHVGCGLVALGIPVWNVPPIQVLALTGVFAALIVFSERHGWLCSVHAARPGGSWGGHTFPLAILLVYLAYMLHDQPRAYIVPLLLLCVSDTLAALVGRRWPRGRYQWRGEARTLSGSLAFFASALLILLLAGPAAPGLANGPARAILARAAGAAALAAVEALSVRGWDNLTVPLAAVGMLLWLP